MHNRQKGTLSNASVAHSEDLQITEQVLEINKIIRAFSNANNAQTVGLTKFVTKSRVEKRRKKKILCPFRSLRGVLIRQETVTCLYLQEDIFKGRETTTEEEDILRLNPDSSMPDF